MLQAQAADDEAADAFGCQDEADRLLRGEVTRRQSLLDHDADVRPGRLGDHVGVRTVLEVVLDHQHVGPRHRRPGTLDGPGGHADRPHEPVVAKLREGLHGVGLLQDPQVIAVGVDEHHVDDIGAQPYQALFDAPPDPRSGEVVGRPAVPERLADLGREDDLVAPPRQCPTETLLADAVCRCGVDVVDTHVEHAAQNTLDAAFIRQIVAVGILDPGVAPDLERPEADGADLDTGSA